MSSRINFTYADMDLWLNERQVTEIECLVPDLTGVARGKILPRAKFTDERGMRIPEAVLGMTVTGNYPATTPPTCAPFPPPTATWCSRPTRPPSPWSRGRATRPRR